MAAISHKILSLKQYNDTVGQLSEMKKMTKTNIIMVMHVNNISIMYAAKQ